MSKLAHSDDASMAEIERNAARDAGDLRRCTVCEAEGIVDDPIHAYPVKTQKREDPLDVGVAHF